MSPTRCCSILKGLASMRELAIARPRFEARRAPVDRQVLLHCEPEVAPQLARAMGLELPDVTLTSGRAGNWSALHLSPDEWLLIGAPGDPDLAPRFASASQQFPLSLVDVSERSLAIDIAGPDAAKLLNGACPLDFDRFVAGACTRTLFGKVTVMLWHRGQAIRMSYPRSFDDYVCTLLAAIVADLDGGGC